MARLTCLSCLLIMLLCVGAGAAGVGSVPVSVVDPWARATAPGQGNGAAYLRIRNEGGELIRLVSASAEVAERVEMHDHVLDGDVMRMRPVPLIQVPAGGETVLQPGGLHLMLMGLRGALVAGSSFEMYLQFEDGSRLAVTVPVQEQQPGAHHH
jgi:copper(I)-binding protein